MLAPKTERADTLCRNAVYNMYCGTVVLWYCGTVPCNTCNTCNTNTVFKEGCPGAMYRHSQMISRDLIRSARRLRVISRSSGPGATSPRLTDSSSARPMSMPQNRSCHNLQGSTRHCRILPSDTSAAPLSGERLQLCLGGESPPNNSAYGSQLFAVCVPRPVKSVLPLRQPPAKRGCPPVGRLGCSFRSRRPGGSWNRVVLR